MTQQTNVIKEIIDSERNYVADLEILCEEYINPIRSSNFIKANTDGDISFIFSSIEHILENNRTFLQDLNVQYEKNASNPGKIMIGNLFLVIQNFLEMYTVYCNHYHKALDAVAALSKRSNTFKSFIQRTRDKPQCSGLGLNDYLSKPFQRICKYPLLFKELLKCTPPDHPDYPNLLTAVKRTEQVVANINENKNSHDALHKIVDIKKSITGLKDFELLRQGRRFIREGLMVKISHSVEQERYFFLFNDLLIYCRVMNWMKKSKNTYEFRGMIFLTQMSIAKVDDANLAKVSFRIIRSDKKKIHTIICKTPEERDAWFRDISNFLSSCLGEHLLDAVKKNQLERAREIISQHPPVINVKDSIGNSPLHIVSLQSNIEMLRLLLDAYATATGRVPGSLDVDIMDGNGWTPLHVAAEAGNIEACKILIEKGADPVASTVNGTIPFCYLCSSKRSEPKGDFAALKDVLELLMRKGSSINYVVRISGDTPLHFACYQGANDVAEFLLECGAQYNAKNKRGITPLHVAVIQKNKSLVKSLVSYGAGTELLNDENKSPLELAREAQDNEILEILQNPPVHFVTPTKLTETEENNHISNLSSAPDNEANATIIQTEQDKSNSPKKVSSSSFKHKKKSSKSKARPPIVAQDSGVIKSKRGVDLTVLKPKSATCYIRPGDVSELLPKPFGTTKHFPGHGSQSNQEGQEQENGITQELLVSDDTPPLSGSDPSCEESSENRSSVDELTTTESEIVSLGFGTKPRPPPPRRAPNVDVLSSSNETQTTQISPTSSKILSSSGSSTINLPVDTSLASNSPAATDKSTSSGSSHRPAKGSVLSRWPLATQISVSSSPGSLRRIPNSLSPAGTPSQSRKN